MKLFYRYCRSLKFSQAPDYDYLKGLLRGCLRRHELKEDGIYDWSSKDTLPIENDEKGDYPTMHLKHNIKVAVSLLIGRWQRMLFNLKDSQRIGTY